MITKQQLADAYLDKATADAEALLVHGTGVHAYIMAHFPDEIPRRVLEMYVGLARINACGHEGSDYQHTLAVKPSWWKQELNRCA